MTARSTTEPSYGEFGRWYDAHRNAVLEPALAAALAQFDALVGDLPERERTRIRAMTGRVKSKPRTWRKIRQSRYRLRIASVADVPTAIDDLVGLRVTCINLRDIEMVQALLDGFPTSPRANQRMWIESGSERDYVTDPKDSGYRGWHVNLGVLIDRDGREERVTCELQVRTLLQDGWGELTHEDTYSKDGALPPLVEMLSKRMADLLATLDDIAEDLRTELDRIDEASVAEADSDTGARSVPAGPNGQADDAASMLVHHWQELDRPVDLATLAWSLQREFGAEVNDDWFGHGTFKAFLHHAVPEGELSTGRQRFLLPPPAGPGPEVDSESDPENEPTIPAIARRLRRVDRRFPLLEREQWIALYAYLATARQSSAGRRPSARLINQVTKEARDRADGDGVAMSRRHLDYVARAVWLADDGSAIETAEQIAHAFTAQTIERLLELQLLGARNKAGRQTVERWLRPAPVT